MSMSLSFLLKIAFLLKSSNFSFLLENARPHNFVRCQTFMIP